MTKTNQNATIIKGDDHELTFVIVDSDDAIKDMSGASAIKWYAKLIGGGVSIVKTLTCGISITDVTSSGSQDGIKVTLADTDTNITAGGYRHELECEIGGKRSTLATGQFVIIEDLVNN